MKSTISNTQNISVFFTCVSSIFIFFKHESSGAISVPDAYVPNEKKKTSGKKIKKKTSQEYEHWWPQV